MDYFESNMTSLEQTRNELYNKIDEFLHEYTSNPSIIIESEQAMYGEKYLLVQKDNALHRLNSSYSPKNEAEKWIEQYSFTNINIIITMFGLGSGLFARELMCHKDTQDIIIIYEPSIDIFIHVLHNYDITDIIENDSVVIAIEGINKFDFHRILRLKLNITNVDSQIITTHPGYKELFAEDYDYFSEEVTESFINERTNINTEKFFGKRYIINGIFNARYLNSSNRLMDIKEDINIDIPAVVVAAGPSVKDSIDELRRAKGKVYIFAVDRILDYLLDVDIVPDFVVSIDPKKPVQYFSTRDDVNVPLLCDLNSNWEVLNRHNGNKIIITSNPYFQKMYLTLGKEPPLLNTGASVATAAFSACVQLGFKRIALAGQDMAYDGEYSHAGGMVEKNTSHQDVYVDGINGEKVRSRRDWYAFLNWYQDMVIVHTDIEIIDTKSKGAKIKGAIQMPLQDLIDKYGSDDIIDNSLLDNKKSTFSDEEMESVRKYFSDSHDELLYIKRKAKEAINISEEQIRLYRNNDSETQVTEKNFKKISKINQYMSEQPVYFLLENYITAETSEQISEMYRFTDDEQQNRIETYKKSIKVYQAIIDGAEFAKKEFEENMKYI